MDRKRRKLLAAGAAATAMAAAPRVFAGEAEQGGGPTSFYEKGKVRIHYEEAGSGSCCSCRRRIELNDRRLAARRSV